MPNLFEQKMYACMGPAHAAVVLCVCERGKQQKEEDRRAGSDEMDPCRAHKGIEQVVVAAKYHPRFGPTPV